jgi:hypothetical protein
MVGMRVLAQVASSSSCERVNSEADYIKTLKANRTSIESFERQIYVHHNLRILDRVKDPGYEEVAIVWDEELDEHCEEPHEQDEHVGQDVQDEQDAQERYMRESTP